MNLDGEWSATVATDELRRDGITLDVDDSSWPTVRFPGHWRSVPTFAESDGPLLCRRRFNLDPPAKGRRRWITFDGLFYQADLWLDGAYLGDPEGYFTPHSYDITDLSRFGDEHVVAAEISCAPLRDRRNKRNITGIFQGWEGADRAWNPGGLWRSVQIDDTGPVRLDRLRVLCRDANQSRAHLLVTARLDSDAARVVSLHTAVDGVATEQHERHLAHGINEVSWSIDIADPTLWWPRALGEQPLVEISVDVNVDGFPSDHASRRTGLREVAWNNWTCSINGERIFLKGANLLPPRLDIAHATAAECHRDVALAVEMGFDVVRMYGHIGHRATYDAADESGLLIMQDFPLRGGYQRGVRGAAIEQAVAAVDELGHHPSIIHWSAHDNPASVGWADDLSGSRTRFVAAHQVPSWNKSVLDRWVKRTIERADPTRQVEPHSGVLPHLPTIDGTDSHLYFGWLYGQGTDLDRLIRRVPRVARFVSEFGAQAVPDTVDFIDDASRSWPDLNWEHLEVRNGLHKDVFDQRIAPADFKSFDDWRRATQQYQAELLRYHIERLRRHKYRPTGGFALFALNDPAPAVSASIFDHQRRPKLAAAVVAKACEPIIAILAYPPMATEVGTRLRLPVEIINDTREPIDDAIVEINASWPGGQRQWRYGGSVEPDTVVQVAVVDFEVPNALGRLRFEVVLSGDNLSYRNHYSTAMTQQFGV